MNIYFKGKKTSSKIAITFDDGPHPGYTPRLLEILDSWSAKATFFMTGINAVRYKSIVSDVVKLGHEIGNHSYSHKRNLFNSLYAVREEISSTKKILEDISGKRIDLYRPPYGIISPFTLHVCRSLSQKIILWTVSSYDFRGIHYSAINDRLSAKAQSGSIVLFHDCHYEELSRDYSNTAVAVENLLSRNKSEKLESVTISQLLEKT